jgi:hypothetical protein
VWIGLLPAGAEAAVEGDVEGVEGGLLVGKVAAGVDRAAELRVEGFDGVGGGDDRADLGVEGQEGDELGPGVLPELDDGGAAGLPGGGKRP